MTKENITNIIVNKTGIDKREVSAVVEALMTTIKNVTATGLNVHLRGFGSFTVVHRKAKKGRDIKRNKIVDIPAHNVVVFVKSKQFPQPTLAQQP